MEVFKIIYFNEPEERGGDKPKRSSRKKKEIQEESEPKEHTLADEFEDQVEALYSIPQKTWPRKEIKFSPSQLGKCGRELFYLNTNALQDPPKPVTPWKNRVPRNGEGVHAITQKDYLEMPTKLSENGMPCRFVMKEVEKTIRGEFMIDGSKVVISGRCDGILLDTKTGQLVIWEKKTKDKASNLTKVKDPSPYILQCIAYGAILGVYDVILEIESLQKPQWSRDDAKDMKFFHVKVTKEQCDKLLARLARIVKSVETNVTPPKELDKCMFCSFKKKCQEDG